MGDLSSGEDDVQALLQNTAETTALERECRSRGLAISGATPQQLVERLRHFQEYWVPEAAGNAGQQENEAIQPDPELDGEPCDDEEIAAIELEEAAALSPLQVLNRRLGDAPPDPGAAPTTQATPPGSPAAAPVSTKRLLATTGGTEEQNERPAFSLVPPPRGPIPKASSSDSSSSPSTAGGEEARR